MPVRSPFAAVPPIVTALGQGQPVRVLDADGAFRGLLLARAAAVSGGGPVVYVAADEASARAVAADAAFFLGVSAPQDALDVGGPIVVVPEPDVSPYGDLSPDPRVVGARLAVLDRLAEAPHALPRLLVISLRALMRRCLPVESFRTLSRRWHVEQEVGREQAVADLVRVGYQRVDVVEDPGTFAVRGGVIDFFAPRLGFPVRIEWFGDEIERIRLFDPGSQRSLRQVDSCAVHPVRETIVTTDAPLRARVLQRGDAVEAPSSKTRQIVENLEYGEDFFGLDALVPLLHDRMVPLWEHLPSDCRWITDDLEVCRSLSARFADELHEEFTRVCEQRAVVGVPEGFAVSPREVMQRLQASPVAISRGEHERQAATERRQPIRIELERNLKLRAELEAARKRKSGEILRPLVDHIRRLEQDEAPWRVVLVAPNLTHAQRLTSLLRGHGLHLQAPATAENEAIDLQPPERGPTAVQVMAGSLSEGFASRTDRLMLLAEQEIFGKASRRPRARRRAVGVGSLSQLSEGDLVVHVLHGVGRYLGLKKLTLQGVPGDFVTVEYAGNDRLYLPVYRLGELERYASAEGKAPRLDRMGGSTFATKTRKVKAQVRQMAEDLLQIYAQREALQGHAYPEPDAMYAQFEATFPFEETPDQQDAIDAVQEELSRSQPMDRLVCGDVGFGKTEVALRAAFRVAVSGKQVAVLAPTTVLVQQHYATFQERMDRFGIRVACLNRFLSTAERKRIVDDLRRGAVDVVVGTHRLLSRDVRFKELGLLVIDEEQRFGVAQKERFKRLKTQVDVLALSATPIPRTLHMSLLGIREISLIMTPPIDRLTVRTYLTRPSDHVIEEGIRKELARGGQVFYVVPKIMGIEEHARRVREVVPEARVVVGHGKMPAEALERTMVDFVRHEADVLVSTSIIESGLDIPRANTMFVARADQFGLAQLYQLRGRIGRSRHRAHCYLMVHSLERLGGDAKRRLEAIQRHSELGSGFNVASQDLEIRGAGEILGSRQSGNIAAIGFEAYARVLGEAVAELRGQPIVHETDPEIAFDVPGFLPDGYVEDTGQRLDLYRRLSAARDVDEVRVLGEEIRDRFGELPAEARDLVTIMACKTYGRRLHALALELRGKRFSVRLPAEVAGDLVHLVGATEGRLRVVPEEGRITVTVPEPQEGEHRARLEACRDALAEVVTHVSAAPPAKHRTGPS